MKVYKVVRQVDGKLKSAIERREKGRERAQLTYAIGKTTKPRFGKIFAFRRLGQAQGFRRYCSSGIVFEAKVPDAKPITIIASDALHGGCYARLKKFWEKGVVLTMDAPQGTVVCSELTLVKVVG